MANTAMVLASDAELARVSAVLGHRSQPLGVDTDGCAMRRAVEGTEVSTPGKMTFMETFVDSDDGPEAHLESFVCGIRPQPSCIHRSRTQVLPFDFAAHLTANEDESGTASRLPRSNLSTSLGDTCLWPPAPSSPLRRIPIVLSELLDDTSSTITTDFAAAKVDSERVVYGADMLQPRVATKVSRRNRLNPRRRYRRWLGGFAVGLSLAENLVYL